MGAQGVLHRRPSTIVRLVRPVRVCYSILCAAAARPPDTREPRGVIQRWPVLTAAAPYATIKSRVREKDLVLEN